MTIKIIDRTPLELSSDLVDGWNQIKDKKLREEFFLFNLYKKSTLILLFANFLLTFLILPSQIIELIHYFSQSLWYKPFLTSIDVITVSIASITGWMVYFVHMYKSQAKTKLLEPYLPCIQYTYVLMIAFFHINHFVSSIIFSRCDALPNDNPAGRLYTDFMCHTMSNEISTGNAALMLIFPMMLLTVFKETRLELAQGYFLFAMISMFVAACVYDKYTTIPYLLCWTVGGFILLNDLHRQNIHIFFITRKLQQTLDDNEKVADEMHASEMRHMIANVAHDLKTPLSSFTTGTDLIIHILSDFENKLFDELSKPCPEKFIRDSVRLITQCIEDIRNTNSFMLMTINRCIDYTKASKGMKLVPRQETIDLHETLRLPLNCMKNIQNRIAINLNPIPTDICHFIITDKQWLQENVLCLLSNAVKYSTGGTVTISITLENNDFTLHNTGSTSKSTNSTGPALSRKKSELSFEIHDTLRPKPINTSMINYQDPRIYPVLFQAENTTENLPPTLETPRLDSTSKEDSLHNNHNNNNKESPKNTCYLRVEIEDTGIGMSDEAMQTLFNPFKQTQRLAGGTGLGLYSLAKRVEALNGRYGVQKRKDGQQGSLFWFTIPYKADNFTAALSPVSRRNKFSNDAFKLPSSIQLARDCKSLSIDNISNSMPHPLTSDGQFPSLNVLIVDDSPSIVKMTTMMLKRQGHIIETAENGEVALKKIQSKWQDNCSVYDVILMDLQMPVMDGLEATRRLRKIETSESSQDCTIGLVFRPHQVVIGVSANSDNETMQESFEAGVDSFMPKPFSIELFHHTVQSLSTSIHNI